VNLEPLNAFDALFIGKILIRQHYTGLSQFKKSLKNIARITDRFWFEKRIDKTMLNVLVIEYCNL